MKNSLIPSVSLLTKSFTIITSALSISFVCIPKSNAATTQVFFTDFNSGVPVEFSGITSTEFVQGYNGLGTDSNVFSGNFLRNTTVSPIIPTRLTLTGLPKHDSIDLNFLLAIIDSWDGTINNASPTASPDIFNISIDGNLIFSNTFSNVTPVVASAIQGYTPPVGVELAREVQLGFQLVDFLGDNLARLDSAYNLGLDPIFDNIPHTNDTLTIEWFASGAGYQGGSDESWAIDNVEVIINETQTVPEPKNNVAAFALLVFGGLCQHLWKKILK